MEFLGTKGKWRTYKPEHIGCENVMLADEFTGFDGYVELWHHHYENKEVAKANALLISKSPELLDFLQKHYRFLNLDDQKKAEQLIKEATELK